MSLLDESSLAICTAAGFFCRFFNGGTQCFTQSCTACVPQPTIGISKRRKPSRMAPVTKARSKTPWEIRNDMSEAWNCKAKGFGRIGIPYGYKTSSNKPRPHFWLPLQNSLSFVIAQTTKDIRFAQANVRESTLKASAYLAPGRCFAQTIHNLEMLQNCRRKRCPK